MIVYKFLAIVCNDQEGYKSCLTVLGQRLYALSLSRLFRNSITLLPPLLASTRVISLKPLIPSDSELESAASNARFFNLFLRIFGNPMLSSVFIWAYSSLIVMRTSKILNVLSSMLILLPLMKRLLLGRYRSTPLSYICVMSAFTDGSTFKEESDGACRGKDCTSSVIRSRTLGALIIDCRVCKPKSFILQTFISLLSPTSLAESSRKVFLNNCNSSCN